MKSYEFFFNSKFNLLKKFFRKNQTVSSAMQETAFHYSGLSRTSILFYVSSFILCSLIASTFIVHSDWRSLLMIFMVVILCGIVMVFDWIIVDADKSVLRIRKIILELKKEVALSDIKKIGLYKQKKFQRSAECTFVAIDLRAGKGFDLFLPKGRQIELVAFIKSKI